MLVGNPVRAQLKAQRWQPGSGAATRILVVGGSQGARPLNERLPAGFAAAVQQGAQLEILHQAGRNDVDKVAAAYRGLGVQADVRAFIDDMAAAYSNADLVVARAGATTCAELTALGVASILIPFPQAADDHQTINAKVLADAGAAVVLPQSELSSQRLADDLLPLCKDDGNALTRMREAARALGKPEAAAHVVDALAELTTGRRA